MGVTHDLPLFRGACKVCFKLPSCLVFCIDRTNTECSVLIYIILNLFQSSRMTSSQPLRSPLRIDITSSSEDTSNHDDASPVSLTDSAIDDTTLSPKALESPGNQGCLI